MPASSLSWRLRLSAYTSPCVEMVICRRATRISCHQSSRTFASTASNAADFTHAVIGAGAVGIAIARRLQQVEGAKVVLIEKHGMVGSETSSRNSEVIHAGLYYGPGSLKTRLCVKGKGLMYDFCSRRRVPYRNCGKWIVAQTMEQMDALQNIHDFARAIDVPVRFLPPNEAKRREPDVRADAGVLESPTTGIVDSHTFMQTLLGEFEEHGGDLALASPVTMIETPSGGRCEWRIYTSVPGSNKATDGSLNPSTAIGGPLFDSDVSVTADTIINSAGLYACDINNMILPPERHRRPYYAKGTYFSYSKSWPRPETLVYPAPVAGHGGLGTHLTLDMTGRVRFGPDVEWINSPTDLAPSDDPERFQAALKDIRSYLPGIDIDAVGLDYAGIRPKLGQQGSVTSGRGFTDFYIKQEPGFPGFINLLGIESPGLTSSLAIAEEVHNMLYV